MPRKITKPRGYFPTNVGQGIDHLCRTSKPHNQEREVQARSGNEIEDRLDEIKGNKRNSLCADHDMNI